MVKICVRCDRALVACACRYPLVVDDTHAFLVGSKPRQMSCVHYNTFIELYSPGAAEPHIFAPPTPPHGLELVQDSTGGTRQHPDGHFEALAFRTCPRNWADQPHSPEDLQHVAELVQEFPVPTRVRLCAALPVHQKPDLDGMDGYIIAVEDRDDIDGRRGTRGEQGAGGRGCQDRGEQGAGGRAVPTPCRNGAAGPAAMWPRGSVGEMLGKRDAERRREIMQEGDPTQGDPTQEIRRREIRRREIREAFCALKANWMMRLLECDAAREAERIATEDSSSEDSGWGTDMAPGPARLAAWKEREQRERLNLMSAWKEREQREQRERLNLMSESDDDQVNANADSADDTETPPAKMARRNTASIPDTGDAPPATPVMKASSSGHTNVGGESGDDARASNAERWQWLCERRHVEETLAADVAAHNGDDDARASSAERWRLWCERRHFEQIVAADAAAHGDVDARASPKGECSCCLTWKCARKRGFHDEFEMLEMTSTEMTQTSTTSGGDGGDGGDGGGDADSIIED